MMSWWTVNQGNVAAFAALVVVFVGALWIQAHRHS